MGNQTCSKEVCSPLQQLQRKQGEVDKQDLMGGGLAEQRLTELTIRKVGACPSPSLKFLQGYSRIYFHTDLMSLHSVPPLLSLAVAELGYLSCLPKCGAPLAGDSRYGPGPGSRLRLPAPSAVQRHKRVQVKVGIRNPGYP
ncbi:hypothetical protein DV515_00000174 [Chloebia gouldiae]|uniref:Uncharacterized protein n=1 Tax=Chloebia gouldiae TaxID=44316 RepID=A0A3L8T1B9_CHLGU|nr:hypothetical protein DV515_00000174 [Chloebia gouldiae]